MFLSRKEKEKLVLDLYYNQGKTFRDIAKEVRMSFTDISFILKKKEAEEEKEKNNINKDKRNQQQLSPFAKAYKLYSNGKSPVQIAIDLNISESQVTQFYREYWNLLGNIWPLWKLYQELIDKRSMNIEQVGNAVDTAANKLPGSI
jgi:DNA-directed RNA polymerase specialized sigma subunit